MGANTKIDWCDATWNPVTGCYHGCEYCYARAISRRFGAHITNWQYERIHEIEKPWTRTVSYKSGGETVKETYVCPYPLDFEPTLHRYRLNELKHYKKPRNVFVCSMADLFGKWVPERWIKAVLDACRDNPQHRYLFLTKNPQRYDELEDKGIITEKDTNFWLGSTTEDVNKDMLHYSSVMHTFQSCEPMLAPWPPAGEPNRKAMDNHWTPEWVIFGAETGTRKGKVIPEKSWVDNAVRMCRNIGAKVFMKESLRGIMGDDFIQEFPWGAEDEQTD